MPTVCLPATPPVGPTALQSQPTAPRFMFNVVAVAATTSAAAECGAESAEGAIVIAARSRLIIFLHNFLRPLRKL